MLFIEPNRLQSLKGIIFLNPKKIVYAIAIVNAVPV